MTDLQIDKKALKELQDLDDDIAMMQASLREKQAIFQRISTESIKQAGARPSAHVLCLMCGSVVRVLQRSSDQLVHEPCPICNKPPAQEPDNGQRPRRRSRS